jgi:hypothetical protein
VLRLPFSHVRCRLVAPATLSANHFCHQKKERITYDSYSRGRAARWSYCCRTAGPSLGACVREPRADKPLITLCQTNNPGLDGRPDTWRFWTGPLEGVSARRAHQSDPQSRPRPPLSNHISSGSIALISHAPGIRGHASLSDAHAGGCQPSENGATTLQGVLDGDARPAIHHCNDIVAQPSFGLAPARSVLALRTALATKPALSSK